MFLSEMAFTSTLVTSFSRPPMWDKRKTCTWGRQGWLRRCLSSVTLEQRSKAIYVYLYALSLYSICTSSVCVLGPMCRGLCLLRSCLCLGKKKGRGGGGGRRRSRYHSLCALSLCLSLDLLFLILLLLPWALLFFPRLFLFTSSFYLPLLILLIPLAPSICSPNRLLLSVFVRRRHLHLCP